MRVPERYYEVFEENNEEEALELLKPIYELVQAARRFWKKMVFNLAKKMNFEVGKVKLYLLTRTNEDGTVIIALYVDDCLCIEDDAVLESLKEGLEKNLLVLNIQDVLIDYLSCEIKLNNKEDGGTPR